MTLLISLVVCLCFEMPFLNLDRALNRKKPNFSDKPRTRELYKSKSVDDSITSISQVGNDTVDIPKGSIEIICKPVGDDIFCDEEKNTLRVSIYTELSKSQRDRECGSNNGSKIWVKFKIIYSRAVIKILEVRILKCKNMNISHWEVKKKNISRMSNIVL